ncbi:MAG: flagellar assembly protein FliX, partial [Alphaproteobacteria bacterium]
SQINSLFMLQEVTEDTSDLTEKSKQMGKKLLDALDSLKIDLLSGRYSKNNLQSLLSATSKQLNFNIDPNLKNILREIETRAAVELAKLEN